MGKGCKKRVTCFLKKIGLSLKGLQEGDPEDWWQETFKGHVDTKPKGPEAISLDISFPGSQHVFGIPEHAKALSLPATKGKSKTAPVSSPCSE